MLKFMRKICAMAMAVVFFFGAPVYAHEAVDTDAKGSARVVMKYDGKPLAGGSISLCFVGNITEEDGNYGFSLLPELGCAVSACDLKSDEAAKKISLSAENLNLPEVFLAVDSEGIAKFSNLAVGLYLVRQESAAYGYEPVKPFLISVPEWSEGHYIYDVTAAPKTEIRKKPYFPDEPSEPGKPVNPDTPPFPEGPSSEDPVSPTEPLLPQTGRFGFAVPLLLAAGGVLLITGLILRKKNNA